MQLKCNCEPNQYQDFAQLSNQKNQEIRRNFNVKFLRLLQYDTYIFLGFSKFFQHPKSHVIVFNKVQGYGIANPRSLLTRFELQQGVSSVLKYENT